MQEEVLSLLENHLLRAADLRKKSKTFVLSTLRYRVVSCENSNVPTSEGKVLMKHFKTFHSYPSSLSNQDRMHKFNYVRALFWKSEIL
jgi:hypothetical protein